MTLDGEPLPGAALMFVPVAGGRPAQAVADAEGRFVAWTFEPGDGAVVGEHRVAVSLVEITGIEATADGLEGTPTGPIHTLSKIPLRYGDAGTSRLRVQVEPGEANFVTFALTAKD